MSILDRAPSDSRTHVNGIELFELLIRAAKNGTTVSGPQDAQRILQDPEVSTRLWASATARQFQYRMKQGLRDQRKSLILLGVSEAVLPIPDWLRTPEE